MSGVNKVILIGRCGKEPDVRYAVGGKPVTKVSIATSETWKDKQTGQKQERTEWHNIVFFGRLAEVVGEYVKKGSQIYVEGSLRTSKYEKDGTTRYSTDIVAKEMQMLDGKQSQEQKPAAQPQAAQHPASPDEFDDDIPF